MFGNAMLLTSFYASSLASIWVSGISGRWEMGSLIHCAMGRFGARRWQKCPFYSYK